MKNDYNIWFTIGQEISTTKSHFYHYNQIDNKSIGSIVHTVQKICLIQQFL